jgi:hypothetical protein
MQRLECAQAGLLVDDIRRILGQPRQNVLDEQLCLQPLLGKPISALAERFSRQVYPDSSMSFLGQRHHLMPSSTTGH